MKKRKIIGKTFIFNCLFNELFSWIKENIKYIKQAISIDEKGYKGVAYHSNFVWEIEIMVKNVITEMVSKNINFE